MSATAPQVEDENYLKQVRAQYENYPYPYIDPEWERTAPRIPLSEAFDRLNHFCYSGRRDFRKPFHSLVAGGGTGCAAIALAEQLRDTGNKVVYLDMSEASMKIAQRRAEIRGLDNIIWIRDSLLNIPKLGLEPMDYINCCGVLHHLEDPDVGLRVLSDALKDEGAMGIMVYAKYGRMAVYMMQETLRLLNRDEPNLQKQVDTAKKLLDNLPLSNWLFSSSDIILSDIRSGQDAGIYDLLLHTQDRAYSIPELYEFVGKAKGNIVHFFSDYQNIASRIYDPSFYLHDDHLVRTVRAKPQQEQQTLAELLHGKIEKHMFYLAKHRPKLPTIEDMDMIPVLGIGIATDHAAILEKITQSGSVVELHQPGSNTRVRFPNGPQLAAMWAQANGQKTMHEIYRHVMDKSKGEGVNFQTLAAQFKPFYEAMRRTNWLFLRHKSTAPIIYPEQMQKRISKSSRSA